MLSRLACVCVVFTSFFEHAVIAGPLTLEVSYSSGSYTQVMVESARTFEASHPDIKIRYRAPILTTYDELLQSTLRSAAIGDLPDISIEGNETITTLAARSVPVALDEFIARETSWGQQGYSPAIQDVGRITGETYALAYATSVPIIYVNVDLLKKAGIADAGALKTWDDVIGAAAKVQKLGGGVIGGFFGYQSTGNWSFQALITSQGGRFLTGDGTDIAFDSPEGLRALQILKAFGDTGTVDMTPAQMVQAFASGTIGVLAAASAGIEQIERQAGGRFEMKTIAWPIESENGRIPAGGRAVMIYSKDPKKQRAAWEYVKFLIGPVGQTIVTKGVGSLPVNSIAVTDPGLLAPYYRDHPNQRTATESIPRLTKWFSYPGENAVKASEFVRDQLRRVLIEHQNPEQVLRDLTTGVRTLIGRG